MDNTEFVNRCNYARTLGIEIIGPNDSNRWPDSHRRWFEDVQKLGRKTFESFVENVSIDSIEKPWRGTTVARAERLSKLAERSYRERKNEAGWRCAVEEEIMYRFTVEVACPTCRQRLWQSEIPAATDSIEKRAESLENRRSKRRPCQCVRPRGDNRYDGGINMLFSDRAAAKIKHDPPIVLSKQPRRVKHSEFPDRVFGLRQTDNLRFLLDSVDKRHMASSNATLRDSIDHTPFEAEPEPLLFPFFMIEAKSSQGADGAANLMQSVFCLRRFLKIQHNLAYATEEETQWESGPLVWFLTTRGEQWDLYAGFVEIDDSGTVKYPFAHLWNGIIRREDDALQLLLMIDYVFDWARDIYRDAIVGELNILATGELNDTGNWRDSDMFSTTSRRMSYNSMIWTEHDRAQIQSSFDSEPQEPDFLNIILPEGVIRDASIIESRFILLQITEDDVDTFLLSFSSPQHAQSWLTGALRCLSNGWKVDWCTISSMESTWTRNASSRYEPYLGQKRFYISFALFMFMTNLWEPTRQVTCLAISEGAMEDLLERFGSHGGFDFQLCPEVGESAILVMLQRILKQTMVDNLSASISMLCLSSCFSEITGAIPYHFQVKRSRKIIAGLKIEKSLQLVEMVHRVYLNHKIGQRDLTDPYISLSRLQTRHNIEYRGTTIEMWPHLPQLVIGEDGGVLVDGMARGEDAPKRGLFLFRELSDHESISSLIFGVVREGIYFKTTQIFLNEPSFGCLRHLNTPIRLTGNWSKRANQNSILRWGEKLKELDNRRGCQSGNGPSSPMIISSDDD